MSVRPGLAERALGRLESRPKSRTRTAAPGSTLERVSPKDKRQLAREHLQADIGYEGEEPELNGELEDLVAEVEELVEAAEARE